MKMAESLIKSGSIRELAGFNQGSPIPPATWVDLADTDKANKWLDENLKPVQERVDKVYSVVIGFFEMLLKGLEFVETLLVGIQDPISLILQEIIDIVEAILKDLRNAGFYITWDDAWKKTPLKPKNFEYGYSRVKQELTKKLTDETDKTRPDFTRLSSVFSISVYGGGGATNIRPLISLIKKFLSIFSVQAGPRTTPPILGTPSYTKNFLGDNIAIPWPLELIEEDTEIGGIQVKWSIAPSKKPNFFDVDLPPDSYLITITTRSNPLPLFVEMNDPNSTTETGKATVIKPLRINKASEQQATTIIVPRINQNGFVDDQKDITAFKPFLFAKVGAEKIPYTKFMEETKTFYFKTSALGSIVGGSDYTFSFTFEKLPKKLYDYTAKQNTEDFENYYIYVSSHGTENDSEFGDGDEITYNKGADNREKDFGFSRSLFDDYLTATNGSLTPTFSEPKRIKRNPKEKFKYITSLKESLVRFILVEEYFTLVVKGNLFNNTLNIERVPDPHRSNIYSLFGVKNGKELFKQYSGDRDDVEDFRDEIEDMVRDALVRLLGRGMPSKAVLNTLETKLDAIIDTDNNKSPLLYKLLDEDWDEDIELVDDDGNFIAYPTGIFPNFEIGLESRENESVVTEIIEELSKPNASKAGSQKEQTFIYGYNIVGKDEYVPFAYYLTQGKEKTKWEYCRELLTGVPKQPGNEVGAWKFHRFFADGIPAVEVFLEEILAFLKALKKGFEGIIQAILRYINLLRERINSIRRFVDLIKRIIDLILSMRFPVGLSYLMTETDGTEGLVEALSSAENQPPSGEFFYGTYACFVFGGLPSILVDFLLSFVENQSTKDTIEAIFTGNSEGESDNQIFFSAENVDFDGDFFFDPLNPDNEGEEGGSE